MSKRIKDFGLEPTMFIGFGLTTGIMMVILASVPTWATIRPTDDPAWIIQPTVLLSTMIAFFIGMGDSCINNLRNVICALALPDKRAQAFAISKFYQALAGAILMFFSPYLSIPHYTVILFCTVSLSTICFVRTTGKMRRNESKTIKIRPLDDSSIDKF
ncbi:hypothetical protein TELCIR_19106 [Teladorsagia circumcincta]|uniref:Major facilitator superfamily (MFS) profile domain-containing protein n=1 Tax=Teladorsagia circumcincta TaxID=45464 RepID=A0A2G9TN90_TELCI|nr:hypothetical protein TELCIR_19106 [Teladorsagia circumcincta]